MNFIARFTTLHFDFLFSLVRRVARSNMATEAVPELVRSITEKLQQGTYECVVCTESVGLRDRLWSCPTCFGVFHLPCIVYWSKSQADQNRIEAQSQGGSGAAAASASSLAESFRCPLCQSRCPTNSTAMYKCYCGQRTNPEADPMLVLGSCGLQCSKRRADAQCPHACAMQCHPGPCPPCSYQRTQECFCGAEEQTVGCSSGIEGFECGNTCGKELNCGRHYCESPCHRGPCKPCAEITTVSCHCGGSSVERLCERDLSYSCHKPCTKKRDCGQHDCELPCHDGACSICLRLPARQSSCPCGQTPLWKVYYERPDLQPRGSCTDPIPTCSNICSIPLACGEHLCNSVCHDSACLPCSEEVPVRCQCGSSSKKVLCFAQYTPAKEWKRACTALGLNERQIGTSEFPIRCQKKCKKQLSCGKHMCEEVCCGNEDHTCMKVCHKKAPCGIHECGRLCHRGPCPPCHNTSYDRLFCRCRRTFLEPPVPCGTLPPNCLHPCVVPRACGHPANHNCHFDGECTQCVVPVQKHCGSHNNKMPFLQPCSLLAISCGRRCGNVSRCCGHECDKVCHIGPCEHKCSQSFPELGAPGVTTTKKMLPNVWTRR
ncbi:zinc finger protein, putative [Bodo saltans]|uniref:Zinc finger protein, putative n=1 Tax=Bodo saltans TaxID=75058 RepID=A0A0S4INQ1_BODSA|nr:zinc finger protein, putative [Bodo saltans]|eukprot:CUE77923.1 zinc finger protein, putative [Bodo saltans]